MYNFFSWLYDGSTIYLERKYKKFLKQKEILIERKIINEIGPFTECAHLVNLSG